MAEWLSNIVQQLSPREESRPPFGSPKSSRRQPAPASKARANTVISSNQKNTSRTMASAVAKVETPETSVASETPSLELQFQARSKELLQEQPNLVPSSDGGQPNSDGEYGKADADATSSSPVALVKPGDSVGGLVSGVEGVKATTGTSPTEATAAGTLAGSPKFAADMMQNARSAVSSGPQGSAVTCNGNSKAESSGNSGGSRGSEDENTRKSPTNTSTTDRTKGPASPTKRRTLPVLPASKNEPGETSAGSSRQDENNNKQSKRGTGSGNNGGTSDTGNSSAEDSRTAVAGGSSPRESISHNTAEEVLVPVAGMVGGELAAMISSTRACVYEATEFFVAWQGVLTVAYSGIPPALCELKDRMGGALQSMVPENPGSRWPKTTLACLRDDQRLTPEQLSTLRDICSTMSFQLALAPPVVVDTLSVVLYENCCLEKLITATHIPLQHPVDPSPPSLEQRQYVRGVVDEFGSKNLAKYWLHASKDGNRSSHYRKPKMGATVVHFLAPHEVPAALSVFRRLVDTALPGLYEWFSDDSLHITLRALC